MKKVFVSNLVALFIFGNIVAQKITPIEQNGMRYEILDMTSKGKITWGGYNEEIENARSESNGAMNTKAIVAFVGNNSGFENKPYAAKLCEEATTQGKSDWYLPSKLEADIIFSFKEKFNVEERGSIWTSTEANANQAITKYWYTGANYNNMKVDEHYFVCIRKVD